jgi:alpha-tubulin suppressor-like RCC1 family protein
MIGDAIQGKAITAIATGTSHSCAIADGAAYCAGSGGLGQLGNGANLKSLIPVAVKADGALAGKTVTAIAAGSNHSCAIADGTAYCWGHNSAGQLGNGTATNSNVPTAVKADGVLAGKTVTSITVGSNHSCVVADEAAYCWGYNYSGQVGNSSTTAVVNVPVAVTSSGVLSGKKVTSVANGYNHSCAIADSKVFCWGENGFGQISGTLSKSTFPIAVGTTGDMAGKTVTSLAGGESHTCAIADGKAYCWGSGTSGEIGNGMNNRASVPVAVSTAGALAGKTVTSIAPGKYFTCAVADGKAYCWGSNTIGQGGHTLGTTSNIPVAVADNGVLAGKTLISVAASENYTAAIYS